MQIKNTKEKFGLITKLFHWSIAISIIALIWLGWYMVDLTYYDKWYNKSLTWHKSLGMLVLGAALLKIGWQLHSPAPDTTKALKKWERMSAYLMHKLLLAMMILIPFTGYLISTSNGKVVDIFGWFEIPALISKNREIRDIAIEIHFYTAYATAIFIIGHVAAALKHQFINKDSTLTKMLWR
ncbi:MAG: cytochrome b [Gammaproteobacteria bacterium]|nr:cytochrome b [Gammaproteobacteria bacterium]